MVSKQGGYAKISDKLDSISEDIRAIRNHLEENGDAASPEVVEKLAEAQADLSKELRQRKSVSALTRFIDSTPSSIAPELIPSGFMVLDRGADKSLFSDSLSGDLAALVGEREDPRGSYSYPTLEEINFQH